MQKIGKISVNVVEKPKRKAIIKRGVNATEYWAYCNEVGCDIWDILKNMESLIGEPVCLWLPDKYIKVGTSQYVQGVEVGCDYKGVVPNGFDIIDLPAAKYLKFQGEPFAEENYEIAIEKVQSFIEKYKPQTIGYEWDYENPRIQLEPVATRGYIELVPIK